MTDFPTLSVTTMSNALYGTNHLWMVVPSSEHWQQTIDREDSVEIRGKVINNVVFPGRAHQYAARPRNAI